MEPIENWLPVVGYEGYYEVSDLGRIRSVTRRVPNGVGMRRVTGRVLKQYLREASCCTVNLSRGDSQRTRTVHRMVLEAFVGPQPAGHEGCHNDGNPRNNSLANLRWDDHSANIRDKQIHGTDHNKNKTHCKRGHLLVAPNLKPSQFAKTGGRSCLACAREYALARAQRREFDPKLADGRYRALGF